MSPNISARLLATQSDRRLLELVGNGHERAFEVLVRRYRGELLRYCRRLGLSDSRAEDALQHALLQAWLAIERGVEVRQLRPWLYRIVHNTAVNHVRRFPEDHRPLAEVSSVESSTGVEGELERAMAVRDTLTDVAALPPMQREAILLSAVDGRSHEEVATVLGITDGAVRGLLYRARASLRTAAAALTPQPLIGWLYGNAARVAPSAERLTEISASGGGAGASAGGFAFRGVAVALTAAMLAGGAAVAPLHSGAAHRGKTRSHSTTALARVGGGSALAPVGVGEDRLALSRPPFTAASRSAAERRGSRRRSSGSRHDGGRARQRSALAEHRGPTAPSGGDQSGEGSSGKTVVGSALASGPGRTRRTRGDGGGDGSHGESDGSSGSPGDPSTPQPVSTPIEGGSTSTEGSIATTAGSGSDDSSHSGSSGRDPSDGRGASGEDTGSAGTEKGD